jgi:hypothetical protein
MLASAQLHTDSFCECRHDTKSQIEARATRRSGHLEAAGAL